MHGWKPIPDRCFFPDFPFLEVLPIFFVTLVTRVLSQIVTDCHKIQFVTGLRIFTLNKPVLYLVTIVTRIS